MTHVKQRTRVDAKSRQNEANAAEATTPFRYQSGFGNYFESEAVPGALLVGRNSPQRPPLGLYAEQISGTSFTTARAVVNEVPEICSA